MSRFTQIQRQLIQRIRKIAPCKAFLDYWRIFGLVSAILGRPKSVVSSGGERLWVAYPRHGIDWPMYLRAESSDFLVFCQIFCERELECVAALKNVEFIVDLGANTGLSATYLACRFPNAKIIAVEPDPENFQLLLRNTQPLADRICCVNAAIWSKSGRLQSNPVPYRGGTASSKQFIPLEKEKVSGDIESITLDGLMSQFNLNRIDLLKIDIEGAEAEVFREPGLWLSRTAAIVIELHDDSMFGPAKAPFDRAVRAEFSLSQAGEKVFAMRTVASKKL
jgi:FkbM family methyltransferase